MDQTKRVLLFCAFLVYTLTSCKGNEITPSIEEENDLYETLDTGSRRANYKYFNDWHQLKNILHQCFCFEKKPNDVSVTHKINPNGANLERLVVYLYRDTDTNEIKMYLPNYQKQLLIPDLAFDGGDILNSVSLDAIQLLFRKHSDLLTNRKQFNTPDISRFIDLETINSDLPAFTIKEEIKPVNQEDESEDLLKQPNLDLNIQPIEYMPHKDRVEDVVEIKNDLTDKINTISPLEQQNIMEIVTENPNEDLLRPDDLNKISVDMDKTEEQPVKIDEENKAVIVVEQEPTINVNNNPSQKINISIGNVQNSEIESGNLEPSGLVEGLNGPLNLAENFIPVTPKDYVNLPNIINVHRIPSSNSPSSTELPSISTSYYTPQYLVINKLQPKEVEGVTSNPVNIINNITTLPEREIVNIVNTEQPKVMLYKLLNSLDNVDKHLIPQSIIKENQIPMVSTNINLHDTFDNWFNNQLKLVHFADSKASDSIDIVTLKYLIAKTLHKSGYYLTEQGILVDANGVEFDTANLILRPILIGYSVEYKKLMKRKHGTLKLLTDLPYLEAILLTSISPQKTLGIIPLAKTFLPRNYRTPSKLNIEHGNDCNKCNHNTLLLSSPQSPQSTIITGPYTNQFRLNNWAYPKIKPLATEQNAYISQSVLKPRQAARLTSPYVKKEYRILPMPRINSLIKKIYKPVVGGAISTRGPVQKYPLNMLMPGFRIIGGNAATSSGTPVNVKGRSGLDAEDLTINNDE